MAPEPIQGRLKQHGQMFEDLLSVIPSKYYYTQDRDSSNQWNKKKQTKQEAKKAKLAKFDPESMESSSAATKLHDKMAKAKAIPKPKEEAVGGHSDVSEEEEEDSNNDQDDEDSWQDISQSQDINLSDQDEPKAPIVADKKDQSSSTDRASSIQELKAKLASRIQSLKEKRKAPGTTAKGAPLNREAILKEREEKRLRRKQLEKERRITEAGNDAQDTTLLTETKSPLKSKQDKIKSDILYGQVKFADGDSTTATLSDVKTSKKRKGPSDALGALKHAEAKRARLENMDQDKREAIIERDLWKNALLQSQGEKVRDDETLLKKALKRQKKRKAKSEKEWDERQETVQKNIKMRQKKREENLANRKAQKGMKGKKKVKAKAKRPGFEGKGGSSSIKGKKGKK